MKKGSKKSIILSCALLVLLLVLVPLEIYAWFGGGSASTDTGNIILDVVSDSTAGGSGIDITIIHNSPGVGQGKGRAVLFPDSYAVAKITLKNTTNNKVARRLGFERISLLYPTGKADYAIKEKYIFTESYYNSNDTLFDENSVADINAFYRSFISPVTNAVCYQVYAQDMLKFDEGYTQKYLTALGNATEAQLNNAAYNIIADNVQIAASNHVTGGVSPDVDSEGRFLLAPNGELETFLVLYFNPDSYCSSNYSGSTVTLKNSNPYMSQHFKLKVMFEDTVIVP